MICESDDADTQLYYSLVIQSHLLEENCWRMLLMKIGMVLIICLASAELWCAALTGKILLVL